MRRLLIIVALTSSAVGCSGRRLGPADLVGRWELRGNPIGLGQVSTPPLRLTLFITTVRTDSLYGEVAIYLDPKQPIDNRPCARLAGAISSGDQTTFTIFTTDEPSADMLLEAQIRRNEIIAGSIRPRDGSNVLQPGVSLLFTRQSTNPQRVGCLTSA